MAEHFRFFDSADPLNPDRSYNAQQFTDYFKALITTGVMKGAGNELAVSTSGSNMVTNIDTGIAFLMGRYYENDSLLSLTHDTETLGKNRIDRVVIRLDLNTEARFVRAFIKKGVAGASPIPPALTQNNLVYEISLAQVKVIGGQTYINVADVIDERGQDAVCPWAGSKILPNFNAEGLQKLVNMQMHYVVTAPDGIGSANYSANIEGITEYFEGLSVAIKLHANNNSLLVPTLNINGLGRVEILYQNGLKPPGNHMLKDMVYLLVYNGERFIIPGFSVSSSLSDASHYTLASTNAVKQVNDRLEDHRLAVGFGAVIPKGISYATAIGPNTYAEGNYATAIGSQAMALNANEGQLGGINNSATKDWKILGTLRVTGTKNFEIPHPHPDKKYTHVIRHGAVESPTTGDTLYRYEVEATEDGQIVELQLPDYFEYLNMNIDVWVNPHKHFGRAFGEVVRDKLLVTCEKAGIYKALIIGTRNDENVQDWHIKGVEREIGESWLGEVYVFEVDEISEIDEFGEGIA